MAVSLIEGFESVVRKFPGGADFFDRPVDDSRRDFVEGSLTFVAVGLGHTPKFVLLEKTAELLAGCTPLDPNSISKAGTTPTPTTHPQTPPGMERQDKQNSPEYFIYSSVIESTPNPTQQIKTELQQMCPISWGESGSFKTTWHYKGVIYKIKVKRTITNEIIMTVNGKPPEEVFPPEVRMWVDEGCGMKEEKKLAP